MHIIDAFKLTKSHERDKCVKTAKNCRQWEEKDLVFLNFLKSPALSHILKEYPQKNLLFNLAPFHIHFTFH